MIMAWINIHQVLIASFVERRFWKTAIFGVLGSVVLRKIRSTFFGTTVQAILNQYEANPFLEVRGNESWLLR